MINQTGFLCQVIKTRQKVSKQGTIYWYCSLKIYKKIRGYWQNKAGKRYYELFNSCNIYTSQELQKGDELKVDIFTLTAGARKQEFATTSETVWVLNIYEFTNKTQKYSVCSQKERAKFKRKLQAPTELQENSVAPDTKSLHNESEELQEFSENNILGG